MEVVHSCISSQLLSRSASAHGRITPWVSFRRCRDQSRGVTEGWGPAGWVAEGPQTTPGRYPNVSGRCEGEAVRGKHRPSHPAGKRGNTSRSRAQSLPPRCPRSRSGAPAALSQ